jgi:hypothetical protein
MRELTFHEKQKILANKANFTAFSRAFIQKAFEDRAKIFDKTISDKMTVGIDKIVDHYVDEFWPFEDYPEQNLRIFLSIFNFYDDWDKRGSDCRIHPGVEELLATIEPKEVFEFLHGENLSVYYSLFDVYYPKFDVELDSAHIGMEPADHA